MSEERQIRFDHRCGLSLSSQSSLYRITRKLISFLYLFTVGLSIAFGAQETNDSIEFSEDRMARGTEATWFDSKSKSWVFPGSDEIKSSEDSIRDRDRYQTKPVQASSNSFWDNLWNWWNNLSLPTAELLRVFSIGALILLAIAIVYLIVSLVVAGSPNPYRWNRREERQSTTLHDPTKLVDLPFQVESSSGDLLGHSEKLRKAGDYAQSIIYLFGYVLVELDRQNLIQLQRGKTNRMYLRELKPEPDVAKYHQYLIQVFEAVFFGRYPIRQEQCDRCWNLLPAYKQAMTAAKSRRDGMTSDSQSGQGNSNSIGLTEVVSLIFLGLTTGVIGCRSSGLPTESYVEAFHPSQSRALGGLGVLRALCEEKRVRLYEQPSLSPRAYKLDALLWAPRDFRLPDASEIQWLNEWLASDKPRTLIFVGRDYSPSATYWSAAAKAALPEERATFRAREGFAQSQLQELRTQFENERECAWFRCEEKKQIPRNVTKFRGDWSASLQPVPEHIYLRDVLIPKSGVWTHTPTARPSLSIFGDEKDEIDTTPREYGRPKIEYLLRSDLGEPLIWRMRYAHWGESQVLVFSNASLITNEGLIEPGNQNLFATFLNSSPSVSRLGVLASENSVAVRYGNDPSEAVGFELLRVWPLSLISMHGLFIGFLAMLALWPIFGRPQQLLKPSTTDFGKHIEALGELLQRSQDRTYALQRVAEYFREVRRDLVSPWANLPNSARPKKNPTVSLTPLNHVQNVDVNDIRPSHPPLTRENSQ